MFDELQAREWENRYELPAAPDGVDAFALQHPDRYCASAKSFAAHLTGLCAAVAHNSHPSVLQATRRWLDGKRPLVKPALPTNRGALTIAEVSVQIDPVPYAHAVQRWARCTWAACSALHALARAWIQEALKAR
jgi:hypothetical protein